MGTLRGVLGVSLATTVAFANPPSDVKDQLARGDANARLPMFLAFNGGSLGVPASHGTASIVAAADLQIDPKSIEVTGAHWWENIASLAQSTAHDTAGFVQLAGVPLTDTTSVGVRVETASFRLPRLEIERPNVKRAIVAGHVESVGLMLTRRRLWLETRVAQHDESPGVMAEIGSRLEWKTGSAFLGAAIMHLRPLEAMTQIRPAYSDARLIFGLEREHKRKLVKSLFFDALGAFGAVSAGTWLDTFAHSREWETHVEIGIAVRASVPHLAFALAFHALLPSSGIDEPLVGFSLITAAHQ